MLEEDRPINPDPQALQQYLNEIKQKRTKRKQYLRKGPTTILPCQKQNYLNKLNKKRSRSSSPHDKITKAEQYQIIKQKNRKKFGQWKRNNNQQNLSNEKKNKIKPNQITVDYKPKKVHIDTTQYKKPGYKPQAQINRGKEEEQQKMEYKKMIQYLKRVYGQFEKQKQMFQKQKQYLKFKKVIKDQSPIEIRPKVETGLKKTRKLQSANSSMKQTSKQQSLGIQNEEESPEPENIQIHKFSYKIQKLYECIPFTLKQINKYTNHEQFLTQNNKYYQQAKQILNTSRNNPKNKVKIIKPKCTHGSIGANHSVCTEQECAQKRITKFGGNNQGWFQMWIAGRYRSVYNQNIGYKAVWYNNNDVKQQFSNGRVISYQCHAKKVIQVKVDKNIPFWYFPFIDQLQMKDQKGNKQIIFSDGRHQIIMSQQNM